MLVDFIALADAQPAAILHFARTWGPLTMMYREGLNGPRPERLKSRMDLSWEPLSKWYAMAREYRALLAIADRLHRGRSGRSADWRQVEGCDRKAVYLTSPNSPVRLSRVDIRTPGLSVELDRTIVAETVNDWQHGSVSVSLEWLDKPAITSGGRTTLGALALLALLAVARPRRNTVCSGCERVIVGRFHSSPNRRAYCDECRAMKVPVRDNMRDWRRREREKKAASAN
jgi:hypothetical protein